MTYALRLSVWFGLTTAMGAVWGATALIAFMLLMRMAQNDVDPIFGGIALGTFVGLMGLGVTFIRLAAFHGETLWPASTRLRWAGATGGLVGVALAYTTLTALI